MSPETHYAKSGDVSIAYQVTGEGPIDLVYVPGWVVRTCGAVRDVGRWTDVRASISKRERRAP